MSIRTFLPAALSIAFYFAAPVQASHRPCPPDINCSGVVNVDDLLALLGAWGTASANADLNHSGNVDVDDLLVLLAAWGPCVFDFGPQYPDAEAHQIGLEMLGANGPLTLPQDQYDRIDRDLDLIRAEVPALANQVHTMAWAPNQIIVQVLNQQDPTYLCYNTYYQVVSNQPLFSNWRVLTFAGKINVPGIAARYQSLASTGVAEPNGLIGGQNFWVPTDMGGGVWRWNIDDGWHDCFDGCDCHVYYVIHTDEPGNVNIISVVNQGQPWCQPQ